MSEGDEKRSVKTSLAVALNDAKQVLELSNDISLAIAEIARKHDVRELGKMTLATMMSAYALVRFSEKSWNVDRKFREATQLTIEMTEATYKMVAKKKEESDGDKG